MSVEIWSEDNFPGDAGANLGSEILSGITEANGTSSNVQAWRCLANNNGSIKFWAIL